MSSAALKAAATGSATADEARNPYEGLKRQLEASKHEFLPLLGNNQSNVDKFVRVVLNAVLATPDLLTVNRRTLVGACMRAAQDGLLPDGREAVLNIYNTRTSKRGEPDKWEKCAQYLPMVGGMIKKLYESGEVTYVDACCVYKEDVFKYQRGDDPKIVHEPRGEGEFADIVAVYCIVKLKNGETKREVMFRKDIERVRGASKSKDNGPWVTWYDQQAIKSVIKRITKQLPRADAFEAIAQADNLASGYSAMGPTIGHEIVPRADVAAAPPPAITHAPQDPLEFPAPHQGDEVPVEADPETGEVQAPPPAAAPAPAAKGKAKAPAPAPRDPSTPGLLEKPLADLLAELKRCADADAASLVLDTARHLQEPEYGQLVEAYRAKFGD